MLLIFLQIGAFPGHWGGYHVRSELLSELLCTRCGDTTLHAVTVEDGFTLECRCHRCGTVTPVRRPRRPDSFRAVRSRPVQHLGETIIGGGRLVVEGALYLDPPVPTAFALQPLLSLARRLKEAGSHYLRLPVDSAAHLAMIRPLREATRLPVVADVGPRLDVIGRVPGAGADAVAATFSMPEEAQAVAQGLQACRGLPVFARVVAPATGAGEEESGSAPAEGLVQRARAVAGTLEQVGLGPLVLSMPVGDLPTYIAAHRWLESSCRHLIRLEYVPHANELFPGLVRSSVTLGSLLSEGVGDIISIYLPGHAVGSVEAAVEILRALGFTPDGLRPWQEGRTELLFYYARKAIYRLLTKPTRMAHELNATPRMTTMSLPSRIITKPYRVLQEIKQAAKKIG